MSTTTAYIILSLIAAIFLVVHIWEELTDPYMEEMEELNNAYEREEITEEEFNEAMRKIEEEMKGRA